MSLNLSTSSLQGSRANQFRSPAKDSAKLMSVGSGPNAPASFAWYDRDGCCWRTCQGSLFEGWEKYSETWPRSGMTRNGIAYRLPPLVPRTSVIERSSSRIWPTPTASDGMGGPGSSGRDGGPNLRTVVGGPLNPEWVEWLMGFPVGWTDLERSGTP